MPHITFHGIEIDAIKSCSADLVNELSQVMQTTQDNFVLEAIHSTFIADGQTVDPFPLIVIRWFNRGPVIQDQSAAIISKHFNRVGYDPIEIVFTVENPRNYYENDIHFDI